MILPDATGLSRGGSRSKLLCFAPSHLACVEQVFEFRRWPPTAPPRTPFPARREAAGGGRLEVDGLWTQTSLLPDKLGRWRRKKCRYNWDKPVGFSKLRLQSELIRTNL